MQREMTVSFADIEAAAARLAGHAIETPLMRLAFAMLKLVVGPGGSVGLAALLAGRIEAPRAKSG